MKPILSTNNQQVSTSSGDEAVAGSRTKTIDEQLDRTKNTQPEPDLTSKLENTPAVQVDHDEMIEGKRIERIERIENEIIQIPLPPSSTIIEQLSPRSDPPSLRTGGDEMMESRPRLQIRPPTTIHHHDRPPNSSSSLHTPENPISRSNHSNSVSRASSATSTSSVQAVPFKIPTRSSSPSAFINRSSSSSSSPYHHPPTNPSSHPLSSSYIPAFMIPSSSNHSISLRLDSSSSSQGSNIDHDHDHPAHPISINDPTSISNSNSTSPVQPPSSQLPSPSFYSITPTSPPPPPPPLC